MDTEKPRYAEFVAVVLAGIGHVTVEVALSPTIAHLYNAAVSAAFLIYLVWRARRTPGVIRAWGFRRDNFFLGLRAQFEFGGFAAAGLLLYGLVGDSAGLPATFWITLVLYPLWGLAQQFALQNLIARNLVRVLPNRYALAVVSAALFALAHHPRLELVSLTFASGIFFTAIYRRVPNLWAVGIVHGVLGSLAYYIVLGEDPVAGVLEWMKHV